MTKRVRMRMPTVRKRSDIAWIAAALTIGVGGAALATASSRADGVATTTTAALPIAAASDPALRSTDPADGAAAAQLADAAGVAGDCDAAGVGRRRALRARLHGRRRALLLRVPRASGGCLPPGR